jgi:hypothetical protein
MPFGAAVTLSPNCTWWTPAATTPLTPNRLQSWSALLCVHVALVPELAQEAPPVERADLATASPST